MRVLERDIFLEDNGTGYAQVVGQLRQAAKLARENQYAIAIGHVGTEGGVYTAMAIEAPLEEFRDSGVELVTLC